MKMVLCVVHSDDAAGLLEALTQRDYRATTISTTGGFLREGNTTILIGTEERNLQEVLELIQESCRTRTQLMNPLPPVMEPGELHMPYPVEVEVGGAIVFVLNVERFLRL